MATFPNSLNMFVDLRLRDIYTTLNNEDFDKALMYVDMAIDEIKYIVYKSNPGFAMQLIMELNTISYFISSEMRHAAHDRIRNLHYMLVSNPDGSVNHHMKINNTANQNNGVIKCEIKRIDPSLLPTSPAIPIPKYC